MIHVTAACEAPGCLAQIDLGFEYPIEPFASVVAVLLESGWHVFVSDAVADASGAPVRLGIQRRTHTYCAAHGALLESEAPVRDAADRLRGFATRSEGPTPPHSARPENMGDAEPGP